MRIADFCRGFGLPKAIPSNARLATFRFDRRHREIRLVLNLVTGSPPATRAEVSVAERNAAWQAFAPGV